MATYNGHNEDASGNILLSIGNGMTATLETGTTASQAYTKGAYLYYNNRLCKVTAAIASGNTLTIGTNIAYTSLGAELTSHLKATNGDEFYFDYKDGEPGYYPSASKTASQFVPIGGTVGLKAYIECFRYTQNSGGRLLITMVYPNSEGKFVYEIVYSGGQTSVIQFERNGIQFYYSYSNGNNVKITSDENATLTYSARSSTQNVLTLTANQTNSTGISMSAANDLAYWLYMITNS